MNQFQNVVVMGTEKTSKKKINPGVFFKLTAKPF